MNALDYQAVKEHINIMNVAYHLCLEIVEEKSTFETGKFLEQLES